MKNNFFIYAIGQTTSTQINTIMHSIISIAKIMTYETNTERTSAKNQANDVATSGMTLVHVQHAMPLAKDHGCTVTLPAEKKYEYKRGLISLWLYKENKKLRD
jgi:hypothetical protein